MSSIIAVAGGTGNVGRAIVDALNAAGKSVIILARGTSAAKEKEIGAPIVAVNYEDIPSITAQLQEHGVDTIISTVTSTITTAPELALIAAAEASAVTKRFIPSIWGVKYGQEAATIFPPGAAKLEIIAAIEKTTLEYSSVYNGYFLDYYGLPKVETYMAPFALVIDIPGNAAGIPGSGDVPVAFTHTWDIAKFIAAFVEKPFNTWEKEVYIVGDKVTWNEFVAIAEEAKGVKFNVARDSLEKLQKGEVTELPSHPSMYSFFPKPMLQGFFAAFGIFSEQGIFNLTPTHTLNDEFPNIKARTVKEVVTAGWKA